MFGLSYRISIDDLKAAKKTVLMTHPDKSGLPSDYFLFYKRAFEQVVQYYTQQNRQNQVVNESTSTTYVPLDPISADPEQATQVRSTIEKISAKQFHNQFNELFEKNMVEKRDESHNEWFRKEEAPSYLPTGPVSASNMGSTFEQMKLQQRESGMVRYGGVRELSSFSGGIGTQYYDRSQFGGAEEDDAEDVYISSDPFSKLKFEDLRKVHKDQTVFAVSESDYDRMPKYANVNQYSNERGKPVTPMDKSEAERLFEEKQRIAQERAAKLQHYAELNNQEYKAKIRNVMGAFLHLENGRR